MWPFTKKEKKEEAKKFPSKIMEILIDKETKKEVIVEKLQDKPLRKERITNYMASADVDTYIKQLRQKNNLGL